MHWNVEEFILYEDKEILVCRKPAGLAVQNKKPGSIDLESLLKNYLVIKKQEDLIKPAKSRIPYLAVVHRLDQPVEGLVVFAKTEKAAADLNRQLQQGKMKKIYLAVVKKEDPGRMRENEEQEIFLENYLLKDGKTNMSRVVDKSTQGARKAALFYRIISQNDERMLVRIHLLTGRHHQIRVQMANAGMPLVGDQKYGGSDQREKGNYPALCAAELTFTHPATGKELSFCTEPEGRDFSEFALNGGTDRQESDLSNDEP